MKIKMLLLASSFLLAFGIKGQEGDPLNVNCGVNHEYGEELPIEVRMKMADKVKMYLKEKGINKSSSTKKIPVVFYCIESNDWDLAYPGKGMDEIITPEYIYNQVQQTNADLMASGSQIQFCIATRKDGAPLDKNNSINMSPITWNDVAGTTSNYVSVNNGSIRQGEFDLSSPNYINHPGIFYFNADQITTNISTGNTIYSGLFQPDHAATPNYDDWWASTQFMLLPEEQYVRVVISGDVGLSTGTGPPPMASTNPWLPGSKGIFMNWNMFGAPPLNAAADPTVNQGHTFTHELGHLFDLYHTNTGNCSGVSANPPGCFFNGDFVCDTDPIANIPSGTGCVRELCNMSIVPYDNIMHGDLLSVTDACRAVLTTGQVQRFEAEIMFGYPQMGDDCNNISTGVACIHPLERFGPFCIGDNIQIQPVSTTHSLIGYGLTGPPGSSISSSGQVTGPAGSYVATVEECPGLILEYHFEIIDCCNFTVDFTISNSPPSPIGPGFTLTPLTPSTPFPLSNVTVNWYETYHNGPAPFHSAPNLNPIKTEDYNLICFGPPPTNLYKWDLKMEVNATVGSSNCMVSKTKTHDCPIEGFEARKSNPNKTQENQIIKIFPNPVIDEIFIEGLTDDFERIEILSHTGELVFESQDLRERLNLEHMTAGVYFINIYQNGQKTSQKIVLSR